MPTRQLLTAEPSSLAAASTGTAHLWWRRLVFHHLASLKDGRLTVIDADKVQTFGRGGGIEATVRVLNARFYREIVLNGSLGAGEAYLQGWWTASDLTAVFRLLLRNLTVTDSLETGWARLGITVARGIHNLHRNTLDGSRENIHAHYDLGNDFFRLFLDETMSYSAGIYETPESTLYDASIAKIDRLCRKLDLQPGDHLLEVGTGWGAFAVHAARHYGCRVTTTTISQQQYEVARERIREEGLESRVQLLLEDYRNLKGQYDKIVSVEMIEAVGREYLNIYFGQCCRLLRPEGLMALQGILMPDHRYKQYCSRVDFIQKFVFPGSHLPSLGAITQALAAGTDMTVAHLEDITPHYARTLRDWRERFFARIAEVKRLGYPDAFTRLWDYYLCYCEAGFAERNILDVQLLLARTRCRREPVIGKLDPPQCES